MSDRDMLNDANTSANTDLQRLSEADDFDVAEGYPDIRGWDVKTPDGQPLGKVKDLIVSIAEMRVRYVDVEVDRAMRDSATTDEDGRALLPIGSVELDDANDDVVVTGLGGDLSSYPRYAGTEITHGYETTLRDRLRSGGAAATGAAAAATAMPGSREFYDHDQFEDQNAFAKRRPARTAQGAQGEQALTLSEEQLALGKRQVQQGEVTLRKTVETEHVEEQVPLVHEEVTVERRPLSGADATNAQIGDNQEISVPVMREEAVVSKQARVREEIIVRKQAVTETKTVEADLKRERLDVDGLDSTDRR